MRRAAPEFSRFTDATGDAARGVNVTGDARTDCVEGETDVAEPCRPMPKDSTFFFVFTSG
jgi:hypothetical protein